MVVIMTQHRISDALALGDVSGVRESIDFSRENLWSNTITNNKDIVGDVDGNLLWELVIAPEFVETQQACMAIFVPDITDSNGKLVPMHKQSRFNDRDEHSTWAEYKRRMNARGYSQHGRSKMIVGPWEDSECKPPHPDSCEVYAACHCYEAIVEAYLEDQTNVQLWMTVNKNGLRDGIRLKPGVPELWKRKMVCMLNENNTGSGFGIQHAVNLRIRHAKSFNKHIADMRTSISKLGGQVRCFQGMGILQTLWHFFVKPR